LKLVVNAVWVQTFLVEALRIHAVNSGILSWVTCCAGPEELSAPNTAKYA
jgi:hypothetical protein